MILVVRLRETAGIRHEQGTQQGVPLGLVPHGLWHDHEMLAGETLESSFCEIIP